MTRPLLIWLTSVVSGSEEGGGESQWTEENSESPMANTRQDGQTRLANTLDVVPRGAATPGLD